jgi:hypothetical protein
MAGVGRRAFAAAAWGVTAGVALAAKGRAQEEVQPQPRSTPSPAVIHPWQQSSRSREPQLLPQVPLSGRQQSGTAGPSQSMPLPPPVRSSSALATRPVPDSPPQRSASAMSSRVPQSPPRRNNSSSSTGSPGDSIAQLLKARAEAPVSGKSPFFERYKQLSSSPAINMGGPMRRGSGDKIPDVNLLAASPQTNFDAESEYDDEASALPWATPVLAESPEIKQSGQSGFPRQDKTKMHQRHPTADSESSTSSASSRSVGYGLGNGSGPENEEVVTPSQSWEALSGVDRRPVVAPSGFDLSSDQRDKDGLEQIGEEDEDEGERVVFGGPEKRSRNASTGQVSQSRSNSHTRSRTAPDHSRSVSSSSSRRSKKCAKCGESVGGAKRFVERDGVVLCERDWKKLYLPSCRRCNLPIEKSAVSSSDGQLKGKWHRECFSCSKCEKPFEGDSFYVLGGKPWCQLHYHEEK